MGEKIKKLLGILFSNKKVLFLTLGVVLFLSLAPLHLAQANIFSDILNGIKNLPISIPTLVIVVPLFVITAVLGTISTILSQIMIVFVRATMSIGVTPANQEIVRIGWEVSRDIVNLLFILILVFIGLATILRLQTYQAQKTLPLLIIIALLVNFSGVLVGFVVDIGNLVTNFFLSYTANFSLLGHTLADLGGSILDMVTAEGATIFSQASGLIVQVIVALFYFLIMLLILFVILLLFFSRVVILWILAILAPIAFAAYILPATRKFWNQWWQQLIQWSIIGIPISFFLFLSGKLLEKLSVAGGDPFRNITEDPTIVQSLTAVPGLADFFTDILGKVVALVMLAVGVMLSMQMAPSSAQGIINLGKKTGMGAMKWGGLAAGTALGRKVSPKVEAWGKRLAERGERPGEEKGIFTKTLGKTFRFGERWMGRGTAAGAGRIYRQVKTKDEDDINAGKKEATNKDSADNFRIINEELLKPGRLKNWNRIAGILTGTVANGDTSDIQEALQNGTLSGEVAGRALLDAQRAGPPAYRPIAKALYGRLLTNPEQFGKEFSVEREADGNIKRDEEGTPVFASARVQKIVKEIPEKLTSADITAKILGNTIDKGKAEGKEFMEHGGKIVLEQLIEVRGGDLANALVRRPESREGRREMMKVIREISPEILHRQGADGLIRYLNSSAAQGTGITSPLLPNETNTLLKLLREKDRGPLSNKDGAELQKLIKIWSAHPEAALPEEEIEKVESQIANLEKNMTKPYPALSPTERGELQKGQKENLERLKIQLTKLRTTAETTIREAELPKIEPTPTKKEIKGFKDIASATKSIPEKGKLENRLRMTRGAMRESFKLQQEIEKEIKEVEELLKAARDRNETTNTFESKSIELKAELEKLRKTESGPGGLKDKETLLERELLKKKK